MYSFLVQTTVSYQHQDVIDLLVTALESGYEWWQGTRAFPLKPLSFYRDGQGIGLPWYEKISRYPELFGLSILAEEDLGELGPQWHKVNLERVAYFWSESNWATANTEDIDASEADEILQNYIYGEVVFS